MIPAAGDDFGFQGAVTKRDAIVAERTLRIISAVIGIRAQRVDEKFKGKRAHAVAKQRLVRMLWFKAMRAHFALKKLHRICGVTPRGIRLELDELARICTAFPLIDEFAEGVCEMVENIVPLIVDADRCLHWGPRGLVAHDSPHGRALSSSISAERRRHERARDKGVLKWTQSSPSSSAPSL